MESFDYIFIICCIIAIFSFLVLIIRAFIPKDMMLNNNEINIKRGKIIGSIIGIGVGIFIGYYLWVNFNFDFFQ